MWTRTMIFVLLLPLTACFYKRVVLEKHIGTEADLTPLCTNHTENFITAVVCNIPIKYNRTDQCHLRYFYEHGFGNECGPRIRLMVRNHIMFLRLMDLTPVDNGVYYCECTRIDGIFTFNLNITGEDHTVDENLPYNNYFISLIVFSLLIFLVSIIGVILVFICKSKHSRQQSEPTSQLPKTEGEKMNMYATLQEMTGDIYQTVTKVDLAGVSDSAHMDYQ